VVLNNDVLVSIAATAAKETDGVAGLMATAATFSGELRQKITRKAGGRGVTVKVDGDVCFVQMHIIAKMGVQLADMAAAVQNKVQSAIETMTGLSVREVNVVVGGLVQPSVRKAAR
jgi:uncharacterized alkaline shock family protein YloU